MKKTKTQGLACLTVIVVSFCLAVKFFLSGELAAFVVASLVGWLTFVFAFLVFIYNK